MGGQRLGLDIKTDGQAHHTGLFKKTDSLCSCAAFPQTCGPENDNPPFISIAEYFKRIPRLCALDWRIDQLCLNMLKITPDSMLYSVERVSIARPVAFTEAIFVEQPQQIIAANRLTEPIIDNFAKQEPNDERFDSAAIEAINV